MQQEYGATMPCVNYDTRPEMCPFAVTTLGCVPPLPAVAERAEMGEGGKEEEEWEGITTAGGSKSQHPPTGRRQVWDSWLGAHFVRSRSRLKPKEGQ